MNRTARWMGVGLVFVLCLCVAAAQAQQRPAPAEPQAPSRTAPGTSGSTLSGDALVQGMERARIAGEIIAREQEASGRPFDAAFLDQMRGNLANLSLEQLAEVQQRASGLLPVPNILGDSQADLVYTPVTPCRIIDTRSSGGPITPGVNRSFIVAGICGVPFGPATAAVINFVAVGPAGAGDLRITPFGTAIPLASIINYAAVPGLNIANGPAVTICDPATTACTSDITIQADVSSTDLVADVQGYFARPRGGAFLTQLLGNNTFGAVPAGYIDMITNYVPPVNARAFTFNRCSWGTTAAGQVLQFRSAIRNPTATGTVTIGNAFYLFPSSAGTETIFDENNDFFDLTAGQSYDFGINFNAATAVGGNGTCSALVQIFTR